MSDLFDTALHSGGVWVVIIAWIVIGIGWAVRRKSGSEADSG